MAANKLLKYRPDIDGLRAIAVLAVVAYHVFPKLVPGGFFGVDVFFVISGFLITGIMSEELKTSSFKISSFYSRRIRRIFPTLLILMATVLCTGYLLLIPSALELIGKDIAAGALFSSNLLLAHESGYFEAEYIANPFLHLWSLGIEEQFYIVWPLIIFAFRRSRSQLLLILIGLSTASFVYSLLILNVRPELAFLSPISRFWELSAGGILSLSTLRMGEWKNKFVPNILAWSGILAVIFSYTVASGGRSIPGFWAFLPVFGAAALIAAGRESFVSRSILSAKPFVWIGLISYPLYLWHWPLVSVIYLYRGHIHSAGLGITIIVLSFVFAWLTYRFIETPLKTRFTNKGKVTAYIALMILVGAAGFFTLKKNGFPYRYPGLVAEFLAPVEFDFENGIRAGTCQIQDDSHQTHHPDFCIENIDPLVFLWGDSHAAALYPALKSLQNTGSFGIAQLTAAGCPPIQNFAAGYSHATCAQINDNALAEIKSRHPKYLIMHSTWRYWSDGTVWTDLETDLNQTLVSVRAASPTTKIIIVGPVPTWRLGIPQALLDWFELNKSAEKLPQFLPNELLKQSEAVDKQLQQIADAQKIEYVSAVKIMCPAKEAECLFKTGESPKDMTAVDMAHLSKAGADYLVSRFSTGLHLEENK